MTRTSCIPPPFTLTTRNEPQTQGPSGQKSTEATGSILRRQAGDPLTAHSSFDRNCADAQIFYSGQHTHMGSPCSPALCNLVVAVEEQCWHHTYGHLLFNHKHFRQRSYQQYALYFATRYVDNRVLLLPKHLLTLPPFLQLTDASFYRPPVQLETEPANIFLGFAINPERHRHTTAIYTGQTSSTPTLPPPSRSYKAAIYQARTRLRQRVSAPHSCAHVAIQDTDQQL